MKGSRDLTLWVKSVDDRYRFSCLNQFFHFIQIFQARSAQHSSFLLPGRDLITPVPAESRQISPDDPTQTYFMEMKNQQSGLQWMIG